MGFDVCHSIIDDHTRLAYTEIHADQKVATVTGFVQRVLVFFAAHAVPPKRLQRENREVLLDLAANVRLTEALGHESFAVPLEAVMDDGPCVQSGCVRAAARRYSCGHPPPTGSSLRESEGRSRADSPRPCVSVRSPEPL